MRRFLTPWIRPNAVHRANRAAALVVAVIGASYIVNLRSAITDFHGDEAAFISTARSIAAGEGFREAWSYERPPYTMGAPLLPIALAPLAGVAGARLVVLKAPIACAAVIALWLLFLWARTRVRPAWAVIIVAAIGTSDLTRHFATSVMSDAPLLAIVLGTLVVFERAHDAGLSRSRWLALIALCLAAFFMRKIAVSLVVAVALVIAVEAFRRATLRRALLRTAITVALLGIPVFLWGRHEAAHVSESVPFPYRKGFTLKNPYDPREGERTAGDHIERALVNARFYVPTVGELTLPVVGPEGPLRWGIGVVAILLAILGLAIEWRRNLLMIAFVALNTGILLIWVWYGSRLLVPLLPIVLVQAVAGASWIVRRVRALRMLRFAGVPIAAIVVALSLWNVAREFARGVALYERGEVRLSAQVAEFLDVMRDLPGVVPANAVLVSPIPAQTHFFTGRRGYGIPWHVTSLAEAWRFFADRRVTHLLVDETISEADHIFRPLVERYADRIHEAYRRGAFRLFTVRASSGD